MSILGHADCIAYAKAHWSLIITVITVHVSIYSTYTVCVRSSSHPPRSHCQQRAAGSSHGAPPSQSATHCHSASALRTESPVLYLQIERAEVTHRCKLPVLSIQHSLPHRPAALTSPHTHTYKYRTDRTYLQTQTFPERAPRRIQTLMSIPTHSNTLIYISHNQAPTQNIHTDTLLEENRDTYICCSANSFCEPL